eukprot:7352849-Heterocapsa_arctica.AAC.1
MSFSTKSWIYFCSTLDFMTPTLQGLHKGRGERQHTLDAALRPVGVHDLVPRVAGLTAGVDAPRGF